MMLNGSPLPPGHKYSTSRSSHRYIRNVYPFNFPSLGKHSACDPRSTVFLSSFDAVLPFPAELWALFPIYVDRAEIRLTILALSWPVGRLEMPSRSFGMSETYWLCQDPYLRSRVEMPLLQCLQSAALTRSSLCLKQQNW
jgi:hypothetical protein